MCFTRILQYKRELKYFEQASKLVTIGIIDHMCFTRILQYKRELKYFEQARKLVTIFPFKYSKLNLILIIHVHLLSVLFG